MATGNETDSLLIPEKLKAINRSIPSRELKALGFDTESFRSDLSGIASWLRCRSRQTIFLWAELGRSRTDLESADERSGAARAAAVTFVSQTDNHGLLWSFVLR